MRTRTEVVAIDRVRRPSGPAAGRGAEYDEAVRRAHPRTGRRPLRPPIPGIDLPGIFTLRNLVDVDRIKAAVDRGWRARSMVGAGFIGLELAENLVRRGIETTLIELQDQVLPPLDREMTRPDRRAPAGKGVDLLLGESAEAFQPAADGLDGRLKSGETLSAELVVLGIGVRPENGLAVEAGLAVGPRGHPGQRRTADQRPLDLRGRRRRGDADFVSGAPTQVPLAGPANRQGRIAADHIFGRDSRYRGTQGTAIVGFFDLVAAVTGAVEKRLVRLGRPYRKVYVHPDAARGL